MRNPFKWPALALIALGLVGLIIGLPIYLYRSSSTTAAARPAAPAPQQLAAAPQAPVSPFAVNTSDKCTGPQARKRLTESEDAFNPYGCHLYWKTDVAGKITLIGTTVIGVPVSMEIGAGETPGGTWNIYKAKASPGTGTAEWTPILCVGAKKNMATNDCA